MHRVDSESWPNPKIITFAVQAALNQVSKILDTEARPVRLLAADETEHTYDDKFSVAENLTSTAKTAFTTVLQEALGLITPEQQSLVADKWLKKNNEQVTIRFSAQDSCTFLKEADVQVSDGTYKTEVKSSNGFLGSSTTSREMTSYRTVKEYHWKVEMQYKLSLYAGNDVNGGIVLKERKSETVLVTRTKQSPLPPMTVHKASEASLTWFLRPKFSIDRNVKDPITPRRNAQIDEALDAVRELHTWVTRLSGYFVGRLQKGIMDQDSPVVPRSADPTGVLAVGTIGTIQGLAQKPAFNGQKVRVVKFASGRYEVEPLDSSAGMPATLALKTSNLVPDQSPTTGPALDQIEDSTIVVPILPVLEDEATTVGTTALSEHRRSLRQAISDLEKWYPNANLVKIITAQEAVIVLAMSHLSTLFTRYGESLTYIEATLRKQLSKAIGKEVKSVDFDAYMQYHYKRRLFGPSFQPKPLCRAVRRPGCFPDGTVTLEQVLPGTPTKPVSTWVRESATGSPFYVPIHAAASVALTGPKFLHGWMQHRFGGEQSPTYQLACRARQFSSFMVVIGTVSGPDTMEPEHAIVVQNKDDLLIPLLADPLPSAKEFKDAIQSLSPEQQEFAKEFRSMQLSSSVFGICIVQLKPQLERLLGLPDGGLTKEIQLTQDLMSLFVDYQIPSDMLTYDGPAEASPADKVAAVKEHTKAVMDVIDESKKKYLKEEEMRADMRYEQNVAQNEVFEQEAEEESYGIAEEKGSSGGLKYKKTERRRLKKMSKAPVMARAALACASGFSAIPAHGARAPPPPGMALSQQNVPVFAQADEGFVDLSVGGDAGRENALTTPNAPSHSPGGPCEASAVDIEDFTVIPKILDGKLERLDPSGSLRSTIIKAGDSWQRNRQENLLTETSASTLRPDDIKTEKKKAFDLLDAMSRSGTLSIECSELHVFVAVSHVFDHDVVGTVIQDNINPISKVERSALLLASTSFGVSTGNLIGNDRDTQRLKTSFPLLFGDAAIEQEEE